MSQVVALPEQLDLSLYAGDDFSLKITRQDTTGSPMPMAGGFNGHIKDTTGANITDFSCDSTDAETLGVLGVSLTAAQTRDMYSTHAPYFRGKFDIQWTDLDGNVLTLVQGGITVTGDITP
jgi:hypothetical protein